MKKAKKIDRTGRHPWGGNGTCHYCNQQFSWKTQGLANANREVFCDHDCFNKNIERNKSLIRETYDFDSL